MCRIVRQPLAMLGKQRAEALVVAAAHVAHYLSSGRSRKQRQAGRGGVRMWTRTSAHARSRAARHGAACIRARVVEKCVVPRRQWPKHTNTVLQGQRRACAAGHKHPAFRLKGRQHDNDHCHRRARSSRRTAHPAASARTDSSVSVAASSTREKPRPSV